MANELMEVVETGIETKGCERVFRNKKLQAQTKAIEKLMLTTKRSMFEIAIRLSVISSEKLYEADDYKDVFDYAQQVLGYKKNMVYKMVTVADKFIEVTPDGKGYVSIITHDDEDYTVSQLIELNSLDNDDVIALDENSVIEPDMTTKEIREVVKEYKQGTIDIEGNDLTESDESSESDEESDESIADVIDEEAVAIQNILNGLDTLISNDKYESVRNILKEYKVFIENIDGVIEGTVEHIEVGNVTTDEDVVD